jgi:DNA-binding SARP family transcriptional activator
LVSNEAKMTALLEISTLGGVAIKLDGAPITKLASRKAEALLVYLACTEQEHAREVLADFLWDDRPQDRAMTNLRVLPTSLRRHLGPYVSITRLTVAFNPDSPHWLDTAELERGLVAAREQRTQSGALSREGVAQLAQSLDLYQGDFLQGFYLRHFRGFEEWQGIERERLRLQVSEVLHELVTAYLDLGEYATGIEQARQLLQLDPLREDAHRQLMWLLVFSNQRNAALAQYDACRQVLAEELGVEPTAETIALYERIRTGELSQETRERRSRGEVSPSPLTSRPLAPLHNLAAQLTPLIGREKELTELTQLLADSDLRLVTIIGPGGIGKTRLALETARAQLDHPGLSPDEGFNHGIYFVSFAKRKLTNEMWEDMKWGWSDETFRKRVTGGDQCVA